MMGEAIEQGGRHFGVARACRPPRGKSGDAGRAEDVAAELYFKAGFRGAPADHAIGFDAIHRLVG